MEWQSICVVWIHLLKCSSEEVIPLKSYGCYKTALERFCSFNYVDFYQVNFSFLLSSQETALRRVAEGYRGKLDLSIVNFSITGPKFCLLGRMQIL